jgi:DNA-binding transcriptional regulator GbsR (MarR family)
MSSDPAASPSSTPGGTAALEEARRRFVDAWGRMAGCWGVPRSMAEVHALLFIESRPMCADEIMERLGISRGNASMTLRTLVDWGIVTRDVDGAGRRERYAAEQDVWRLFATVIRARKRRELDPLLALLGECRSGVADVAPGRCAATDAYRRKVDEMLSLVQAMDAMSEQFMGDAPPAILDAMRGSQR